MKKYEVKITKMAYGNMQGIVRYISNELFAPDAAANLLNKFQESINGLSDMSEKNCYMISEYLYCNNE